MWCSLLHNTKGCISVIPKHSVKRWTPGKGTKKHHSPQWRYKKACHVQACRLSISHYFYFCLRDTVKPESPLTLQKSSFQAYCLNHRRYVGKTGHPIKPRKWPPVLTYSEGTESLFVKTELVLVWRIMKWDSPGTFFVVLFNLDHFDSWGRCTLACVPELGQQLDWEKQGFKEAWTPLI